MQNGEIASASGELTSSPALRTHVEQSESTTSTKTNDGVVTDTHSEAVKEERVIPDSLPQYLNKPGFAPIKLKFIKQVEKNEGERKSARAEEIDRPLVETVNEENTEEKSLEPPRKKKRGQNKKRPQREQFQASSRYCPSLLFRNQCAFGDKCLFIHDKPEYMKIKPPDIGEKCVLFETYGKCRYGLTCRFGKEHIAPDYESIINNEKYNPDAAPGTRNILDKELQTGLRKGKIEFPKSEHYLKILNKLNKEGQELNELSELLKPNKEVKTLGTVTDEDAVELRQPEKKQIDFSNKLFLAPLTTVGNLPFRRVCKRFGADITCGEMAMCTNLLQGQQSEWALLKRHESEDIFGVQICGSFPDSMTKCAEMLQNHIDIDFIDINVGCPIDLVFKKGAGSALMARLTKFEQIVRGMKYVMNVPVTVKMRAGIEEKKPFNAHKIIPRIREWGASLTTVHGRSRQQRYSRLADWDYISQCAKAAHPMPLFGNGDILSYEDANRQKEATGVSGLMIARGALIKPWIFTEIKEQRHWDISSKERFDILQQFVNYGLEHWGSDQQGVEITRRFLLEWLSFLCRYIPVGLLEYLPQKINERPPPYFGRDDLETLMGSPDCKDWIKMSEMLLGPVPENFQFLPKHKSNSYS